ncbi:hypothetical protein D3C80_1739870 [compost metagenome]
MVGLAPEAAGDSFSVVDRDSGRTGVALARPAGNVRPTADATGVIGGGVDSV